MKQSILSAVVLLCLNSCTNNSLVNLAALNNMQQPAVPSTLLTNNGEAWKWSPAAASSYISLDEVNVLPQNTCSLIGLQFEADGNFTAVYRTEKDSDIQVEGHAVFTKSHNKNLVVLFPSTGHTKGPATIMINKTDLKKLYSRSFLWEQVSLKNMPEEDFLLMVDVNAHPEVEMEPGTINKAWVMKFYKRK